MRLQIESANASVIITHGGAEYFPVSADAVHLQGVLVNLLDNCFKYSGENNPRVEIHIQALPGKVELSVRDHGPGISPGYHHKIFEKFFRIPNGNIHNVKGYGLGLSYCSQVIKQHNGQMKVDEGVVDGLRVVITLPLGT
jgi:two-component system phosphate regulon sensor histidine kinase PhoR